jgi:hypothetical protein
MTGDGDGDAEGNDDGADRLTERDDRSNDEKFAVDVDGTEHPDGDEEPPLVSDEPVQSSWSSFDCFGCGPANPDGLHLHSYERVDGSLVATVDPDPRFKSGYPNVTYGGLLASVIDCHAIWTAMTAAYRAAGRDLGSEPRIAYATGELDVTYRRPTPLDRPFSVHAHVDGDVGRRVAVSCTVRPAGADAPSATADVTAVRVDWG